MASLLSLSYGPYLGNSFVIPFKTPHSIIGWKSNYYPISTSCTGTVLEATPTSTKGVDEKLNLITTSLLEAKDSNYWSDQLTEEQIEDAKYAAQEWAKKSITTSSEKKSNTTQLSAEYMERILKRLGQEKQNGNDLIALDGSMYEILLDVWSKLDLPERAESILNEIQSINEKEQNNIQLDVTPYNTIIHSYKRNGKGEKAENILRMMQKTNIQPDVISYNGVILAYARNYAQIKSADKAQRILEEMQNSGLETDTFLYNAVMDAHAKSKNDELSAQKAEALLDNLESYEHIQPNTISYTSVIDAYAKSNSKDRADCAERVFRKMEAAHKAGNENAEPNVRSFNAGKLVDFSFQFIF